MTILQENVIDHLESQIPELSVAAVRVAYWQTLASGQSVLVSDAGAIYEVSPDGTRQLIKKIAPTTPVKMGTKVEIR